jgi:hypothetical protein
MLHCFSVNLNLNPLREGIDINSYGYNRRTDVPISDTSNELVLFIQKLNLKIVTAEIFYTLPFATTVIHLDRHGGDYTKLNYIYGGKNSFMNWYKQKPNVVKEIDKSKDYIAFVPDEVELIDKQSLPFSSIIQAGVPHNINNFSEKRYCLSLVISRMDDSRLTMNESIEIFQPYHI